MEAGRIKVEKEHLERVTHESRVKMMDDELEWMKFKLDRSAKRVF